MDTMLSAEAKSLLLLYAGMIFLNVLISVWFRIKYRGAIYTKLLKLWIAVFLAMALGGATQNNPLAFLLLAVMPTCYAGAEAISEILLKFIDAHYDRKRLRLLLGVCMATCAILYFAGLPFMVCAIPASIGIVTPYVYSIVRLVREKREPLTPAKLGLVLTCSVMALHGLDLPFLGNRPDTIVLGMSLGILVAFGYAIFTPMVLVEMTTAEAARVQKDLELTLAVQAFLLPKKKEFRSSQMQLVTHYKPAVKAGGDWWWVDETPDGRVHILMGDVTGHGPDSAMVTALVASSYQTMIHLKPDASPGEILRTLSVSLHSACAERYLMTMTVIDFDPGSASYRWATAGAPPFFHLSDEGKVRPVGAVSSQLGTKNFKYAEGTEKLATKERLILFTDGVTELEVAGRQLGLRQWEKLVVGAKTVSIEEAREALAKQLNELTVRSSNTVDDITFLVAEPKATA